MKAIDERALANQTLAEILERVGAVVAAQVHDMLGEVRGKTILALCGPGLNGADARAASVVLRRAGADVIEVDALNMPKPLPVADLVLDGAFGIGLSRAWEAPVVGRIPILAIDIPSGISGVDGLELGSAIQATRTITLGGYKAGLLFGDGPDHCGEVVVGDIGLGGNDVRTRLIEAADVTGWLPRRARTAHKWKHATLVVAGSASMTGAARLCTAAAMRAGSGYVHLQTLAQPDPGLPSEIVRSSAAEASPQFSRFKAAVIGPGLGTTSAAADLVTTSVSDFSGPIVLDGDALSTVAAHPEIVTLRTASTVLTPHDGEYQRLAGTLPGGDRMSAATALARLMNSIVVLKGAATIVANPDGDVRVTTAGDQRLATAGTGDVLAGIVGAFLAQGLKPFDAAACGAFIHGTAGELGPDSGLIASDLISLIPRAIKLLS